MTRYIIISLTLLLSLSGCLGFYVTEQYHIESSEAIEKEGKVQDTIESYVQGKSPTGYNYKSLEFGDLYVIKDEEIKKLDELIEEKNQLPLKAGQYGAKLDSVEKSLDDKIEKQKQHLKENNIYPWYEVNHLYAFENIVNDSAMIYEFDFEVYPNYEIKDVHKKLGVTLGPKRYKIFKYFLDQKPVYDSDDWAWQESKNSDFYAAAYAALDNEVNYKDKLLLTIIDMTQYIKSNNSFEENDFAKKQVLKWESENIQESLKTLNLSKLKNSIDTLDGEPILSGYLMTHDVFIDTPENKKKFKFYFDLNYVIIKVLEENKAE